MADDFEVLELDPELFDAITGGGDPAHSGDGGSWSDWLGGISREMGQGITLEAGDEITGAISDVAARIGIPQALGRILGREPQNTSYADFVEAHRADRKAFSRENPYTALGANIAGGFAMPSGATLKALGGVSNTAKAAASSAPLGAIIDAIVTGAAGGEGGMMNRMVSGGVSGALGTGITAAGAGGGKAVNALRNRLMDFDPAIARVAEEIATDGITREGADLAAQRLADARRLGVPLNVLESLTPPPTLGGPAPGGGLTNYAKARAQMSPGSQRLSNDLILGRWEDKADRIGTLLDIVSPEKGSRSVATLVQGAARKAVSEARQELAAVEGKAYRDMLEQFPTASSRAVDSLKKRFPSIKRMINSVKNSVDELSDLPDNSTKVLLRARSEIASDLNTARSAQDTQLIRDLSNSLGKIDDLLDKTTATEAGSLFSQANDAYAAAFRRNPALLRKKGLLARLERMDTDGANPAGPLREVYGTAADDVADLELMKSVVGEDTNRAALRLFLGRAVGDVDRYNQAQKIVQNSKLVDQIRRSLPSDEADDLLKALQFEHQVAASQAITAGSHTTPLLVEGLKDIASRGNFSLKDSGRKLLESMLGPIGEEQAAKEASVLFSHGDAAGENLAEILRYLTAAEKMRPVHDVGRKVVHTTGKSIYPNLDRVTRIIIGGG